MPPPPLFLLFFWKGDCIHSILKKVDRLCCLILVSLISNKCRDWLTGADNIALIWENLLIFCPHIPCIFKCPKFNLLVIRLRQRTSFSVWISPFDDTLPLPLLLIVNRGVEHMHSPLSLSLLFKHEIYTVSTISSLLLSRSLSWPMCSSLSRFSLLILFDNCIWFSNYEFLSKSSKSLSLQAQFK